MIVTKYYLTPPDEVFAEVKMAAEYVWGTFDNDFGYVTEKPTIVTGITNHSDNWMHLIAMFDLRHQRLLLGLLSPETLDLVIEAAESVGYDFYAKWPVS